MSQSDSEQQLRIWKDLAIGKQMLMNDAASVLKLKDDFTSEDLKSALNDAVKRARDADDDMARSRDAAAQQVEEMQQEVRKIIKSRTDAETQLNEAAKAKEAAEQQLANGRKDNAEALKKAKRQVEEKQKELKAINVALADTPENIVKKLKTLKKQKLDENNARKAAEDANRVLKKENKTQKEKLEELEAVSDNSVKLLEAYNAMREWAESASSKLKDASVEIDDMPTIDASVLASVEALVEEPEEELEAATA